MTVRRLAALLLAGLLASPAQAQGVLDRLLGDDPGRAIAPADLVAAHIWVFDPRRGLSNFPQAEMRPGPHVLVILTANTRVPSLVLRTETGAECAAAARSLTSVHGGGLAYCHPLA
ncbi:hypothetical protein [Rubellimicrobium roseum]|uniref:Uncharacterized protein n=1 Tax=Rubellimicrobium roseum TaxID=687525 RepID=A0A5C4NID8_9RHOB|nr:hypothetical protein [Rubellimicrobium roseum]TNC72189.1 hypothetical protein FHG71_09045 [Rubellimicrobium roseum]